MTSNLHNKSGKQVARLIERDLVDRLAEVPAVAVLGPRQAGKSTLARMVLARTPDAVYLDLERPSDRAKLDDPEAFLTANRGRLVCLDEIQRTPGLFEVMRSEIDDRGANGQFIVLGSSSPELLRQSSETLAGRIAFLELSPFVVEEVDAGRPSDAMRRLWLRGGYPRSYLAADDQASFRWRDSFITTFLERDIPQLAQRYAGPTLERFWKMCAHVHGQLLNRSKLGDSLDISYHTVQGYIDLLEHAFILRTLRPYGANLKKRLVKSPKVYVRDAGLLHGLLGIVDTNELLGHPVYGSSWEGFALEQVLPRLPFWRSSFYRDSNGSEIDLVLERASHRVAVEFKSSSAPRVEPRFARTAESIGATQRWIIAPVTEPYQASNSTTIAPPWSLVSALRTQ